MAATLTKAMLADLHKGNATIKMVAAPADGKVYFTAGTSQTALSFADAEQIFTLKNSLSIAPADAEVNKIQIDQLDEVIDEEVNFGDYIINGNIPSIAQALLDYFFNVGASSISQMVSGDTGLTYDGKGYFNAPKDIVVSMLIQSESKNTAIAFARVRVVVTPPSQDDSDNPAYLKFTGYVLNNLAESQGDFAVLKKHTA